MYRLYNSSGVIFPMHPLIISSSIAFIALAVMFSFLFHKKRPTGTAPSVRPLLFFLAVVIAGFIPLITFYETRDFSAEGEVQFTHLTAFIQHDCHVNVEKTQIKEWWLSNYETGSNLNAHVLKDEKGNTVLLTKEKPDKKVAKAKGLNPHKKMIRVTCSTEASESL